MNKTKPSKNILVLASYALATMLYVIIMELTAFWIFIPKALEINYDPYYPLIQGVCQLIIVLIFISLISRKTKKKTWRKASFQWYIIGAILGSLTVVLQSPLNWIYNPLFGADYQIAYDFDGLKEFRELNINVLSTVLFIPIAEELFFRGFIQERLQQKIEVWMAIFFTSLLFAFIHAPYELLIWADLNLDWHQFYITLFGGCINGILYYQSKSVGPSIIFHIFWNLMVVIV